MRYVWMAVFLGFGALVWPSPTSADTFGDGRPLLTEAGREMDVRLSGWSDSQDVFRWQRADGGGEIALGPDAFFVWGAPGELPLTQAVLVLNSGALLVGALVELRDDTVVLETSWLGERRVRLERLAGILLPTTSDRVEFERLRLRLESAAPDSDTLHFRDGTELAGGLLAMADGGESWTFAVETPDAAGLGADQTLTSVSGSDLRAVVFSRRLRAAPDAETRGRRYVWVGLRDGTLWPLFLDDAPALQAFREIRREVVYLESPRHPMRFFDPTLTAATAPSRNVVRWLDEFHPLGPETTPRSWCRNRAADGLPLRLDGQIVRHGFGVEAGATLVWTLDRDWSTLGTFIARDGASPGGVWFRVWSGGELRSETRLDPGDAPRFITVPLEQGRELRLSVESAQNATAGWFLPFLVP